MDKHQVRFEAAKAAMQGLLSSSDTQANISRDARDRKIDPGVYIAKASVEFADYLLAELAAPGSE